MFLWKEIVNRGKSWLEKGYEAFDLGTKLFSNSGSCQIRCGKISVPFSLSLGRHSHVSSFPSAFRMAGCGGFQQEGKPPTSMGPGDSLSLQQVLLEYEDTSCGLDRVLGTEDPGVNGHGPCHGGATVLGT